MKNVELELPKKDWRINNHKRKFVKLEKTI